MRLIPFVLIGSFLAGSATAQQPQSGPFANPSSSPQYENEVFALNVRRVSERPDGAIRVIFDLVNKTKQSSVFIVLMKQTGMYDDAGTLWKPSIVEGLTAGDNPCTLLYVPQTSIAPGQPYVFSIEFKSPEAKSGARRGDVSVALTAGCGSSNYVVSIRDLSLQ